MRKPSTTLTCMYVRFGLRKRLGELNEIPERREERREGGVLINYHSYTECRRRYDNLRSGVRIDGDEDGRMGLEARKRANLKEKRGRLLVR